MAIIDITGPSVEPVSVGDVKLSARVDSADFDSMLEDLIIPAFRKQAEALTYRRFITQSAELVLDAFPESDIDLVFPDVQSITSVKYIDESSVEQTLDSGAYSLDNTNHQDRGWLIPAYGEAWPDTLDTSNAVRIRFVVGFGDSAEDVPTEIRMWIIAHAAQALRAPEGISQGSVSMLPYLDVLLSNWKCRARDLS